MISFLTTYGDVIVSGLMALACAVVGAKIATKSSETQERQQVLREAYADVFAGYYTYLLDDTDRNILLLATAVERAMLICSEQSARIMKEALRI